MSSASLKFEAFSLDYSTYLYGINVRPVAPVGSASRKPYVDSALIHRILPDELLFEVFARMTPYNLGRACVCRKWRYTICNPLTGLVENYKLLQSKYEGSWRKMWVLRPRVRTDGFYVSRNTCIRVGVVKWKVTNPLHTLRRGRYMENMIKKNKFMIAKKEGGIKINSFKGMWESLWRSKLRTKFSTQRVDRTKFLTQRVDESKIHTRGMDELQMFASQENVIFFTMAKTAHTPIKKIDHRNLRHN
ncbi:hypothetical protein UlMin_033640 [Ulmus minor]